MAGKDGTLELDMDEEMLSQWRAANGEFCVNSVELEVQLLSGRSCKIQCPPSHCLGDFYEQIAAELGLGEAAADAAGDEAQLTEDGSGGEQQQRSPRVPRIQLLAGTPGGAAKNDKAPTLPRSALACEVAGRCLTAVLQPPEPEWCSGKRFTSEYIRGRRCGMEEESKDQALELHKGGTFTYSCDEHNHDGRYSSDKRVRAHGEWICIQDSEDEQIVLSGEATVKISTRSGRKAKDTDDKHKFRMTLSKSTLLSGDRGRYSREGWKVQAS